jgi:NADH:ubiquinone oxidoreductase subunit 5 (subunit L)/multisubunit Na+/H+ antiporter MnhA subunit/multisubunit Na+/H+ antiporter MnhB subunit
MEYALVIAVPFVLAILITASRGRFTAAQQGWFTAVIMAVLTGFWLAQLPIISEAPQLFSIAWMPQISLNLTLYLDGLALLFAILVCGIAVAVMLYAGYYFEDGLQASRFLGLLLAFTGAMLGLVLAGNLLTLFIAWEATSIISFLLISFKGKDPAARAGASQALMITGGGGLALLVGLLLMGTAAGSYEFADILNSGDLLRQHSWYLGITVLVLLGCFAKSAQFPLHFWLPGAMAAPTPASAFLHSATMVKAGIYLLARFYPVLADTPLWTAALVTFGLVTMLTGAAISLRQRDLKGILAYTTISQLGAFVALIGLPDSAGLKAAMVGILAHALYKGALFLVAGAVDHATGTRDINRLSGLRHQMPGFAAVTAIVGLSMAGAPPLFGFVGKETLLEAFIDEPLALIVATLSAVFMVAIAIRLFWDVFMGPPVNSPATHHSTPSTSMDRSVAVEHEAASVLDEHQQPIGHDSHHGFHAPARWMVAGPGLLAALSVLFGLGVGPLVTPIVAPAVGAPVSLYLFSPYGINLAFIVSMTVLAAGTLLFLGRRLWLALPLPSAPGGSAVYKLVIRAVERVGDLLLLTQGGKVRYYLAVILLSVILLIATAIGTIELSFPAQFMRFPNAVDALKAMLLILAIAATLASILFKRHLLAVLSLGVSGYAVGGIFLLEPAPDVALVQFLVETLATVLVILILARTSEQERRRAMEKVWGQSRFGIVRDLGISISIGLAVTLFALAAVISRPSRESISDWLIRNTFPELGITDVVAAILTDFRGTDTLIEITVFGFAAIGVLTMLARPKPGRVMKLFRRRREVYDPAPKPALQEDVERLEKPVYSSRFADPITQFAATLVLPFSLMLAAAHVLYGGRNPGDGFTAGVIAGLGVSLWFIVYGYKEAKERLGWMQPGIFIGAGLSIAIVNAAFPLLLGEPFFSFIQFTERSFAGIKLATSTLFEIGIFLTVAGGIGAIMEAISHPREVEPL